jgi:outer membrane protein OmpA-like peptidoglycan-associated protein
MVKFQTIQPLIAQVETASPELPQPIVKENLPKVENILELERKDTLKTEKDSVLQVIPKVLVDSVSKITETIPEETIIKTPISTSNRPWNEIKILDAQTQSPIDYKIEISNDRGIKREISNQTQLWKELEDPQWVNLSISSKGYIPQLLDKNSWIESEGKEILLKPAIAGTAIILENIQFNRGTSDFADAKSIQVLDDFVLFLKENPDIKIRLEGHTDNAGDPSLNKDLSMKRASKIRGYLTINGIEFERVRISGWGGTRPIADNNTEVGRTKNRRVEMLIEN